MEQRINKSLKLFRKYPFLIFGLFGVVILFPVVFHPNWIPMTLIGQQTDFVITHLSFARQINYVITQYHQLPLWNSFQFSGQPFAADPLSGYFYLPNWITFLFPQPITFNLLIYLHLVWSGIGVYLFLKMKKLHDISALFAAICWMGTPKLIGYIAGGQVSSVFALSWLPWMLIFSDRFINKLSSKNVGIFAALSAIVFYADIRWGLFITILAGFYAIAHFEKYKRHWRRFIGSLIGWIVLLLLLTAALSFPLIEFIQNSNRSSLSIQELNFMSIDPGSLFGIIAPQIGIYYEQIIYFGILPLFLALMAFRKKNWFWVSVFVLSLIYSLGINTFFYPLIVRIFPLISFLRVPSRSWFFVIFSVSILSGFGLDCLFELRNTVKFKNRFQVIPFSISSFFVLLTFGTKLVLGYVPKGMLMMAVLLPVSLFTLFWMVRHQRPDDKKFYLAILVLICDLLWINSTFLKSIPLAQKSDLVRWLENQPGLFRVYSPSYSLAMPNNLQQANGVDPMHLEAYTAYLRKASGIDTGNYSVSVPDIYVDSQTPENIRIASQYPDTDMLGKLNVKYLASGYELKSENLKLIQFTDGEFLYENLEASDRVWFEGGQAEISYWSPNIIKITTNGKPGRLVLSEINYPGWIAKVGGNYMKVDSYEGLFRSIKLPSGNHSIEFRFFPGTLFIGCFISLLSWLFLLIVDNINIIQHFKRILKKHAR